MVLVHSFVIYVIGKGFRCEGWDHEFGYQGLLSGDGICAIDKVVQRHGFGKTAFLFLGNDTPRVCLCTIAFFS